MPVSRDDDRFDLAICPDSTKVTFKVFNSNSHTLNLAEVYIVVPAVVKPGRVAPVPVPFLDHDEGDPGPSHLGTGETANLNWQEEARGLAGSVPANAAGSGIEVAPESSSPRRICGVLNGMNRLCAFPRIGLQTLTKD